MISVYFKKINDSYTDNKNQIIYMYEQQQVQVNL